MIGKAQCQASLNESGPRRIVLVDFGSRLSAGAFLTPNVYGQVSIKELRYPWSPAIAPLKGSGPGGIIKMGFRDRLFVGPFIYHLWGNSVPNSSRAASRILSAAFAIASGHPGLPCVFGTPYSSFPPAPRERRPEGFARIDEERKRIPDLFNHGNVLLLNY